MQTPNAQDDPAVVPSARRPLSGAADETRFTKALPTEALLTNAQATEEKSFRGWALLGVLVLIILFIAGVSALIDVIADVA